MGLTKTEEKNIDIWFKMIIKSLKQISSDMKKGKVNKFHELREIGEQLIAVSNNPIQLLDSMNKVCEMIENGELPDNIDDIAEALEEKKIRDKYIFPQILSD